MANQLMQFLNSVNPFSTKRNPEEVKRNLSGFIAPVQLQRIRQDIQTCRDAIIEAELPWYPHRVKQQRMYIDTINNGHVTACWERRKDLTLLRKWEFVNRAGKTDQKTSDIFLDTVNGRSQNKSWFNKFASHEMDALAFGYSLVALGDVINGEFPNLENIKRWNISPDRLNVTNFTYSISGAPFMEEPYSDWHVYVPTDNEIGTSKCGYGFLYKVAAYEILLRNILGYNGDFVELYSQPYRVGKSTKGADERSELENALRQMGSAGYAIIDPEDEIAFLETALGGTGYQGYDNFEKRLEAKISKIILGHADAIDSIPGKLGNSGKKSPAELAMEDKQTKDGSFISNVVNNLLIPKMRNLGFNIPEDTVAILKNDSEIMETNNSIISQAVEMSKGGLQMDSKYFTDQTGIPVTEAVPPIVPQTQKQPLQDSVKNKLNELYDIHKHKH